MTEPYFSFWQWPFPTWNRERSCVIWPLVKVDSLCAAGMLSSCASFATQMCVDVAARLQLPTANGAHVSAILPRYSPAHSLTSSVCLHVGLSFFLSVRPPVFLSLTHSFLTVSFLFLIWPMHSFYLNLFPSLLSVPTFLFFILLCITLFVLIL